MLTKCKKEKKQTSPIQPIEGVQVSSAEPVPQVENHCSTGLKSASQTLGHLWFFLVLRKTNCF